jgi:HK97 gp10 family phage protein
MMSDRGSFDLSDFITKMKNLYPGIERDLVYPKAIKKGAKLLADRIEAATPIRFTSLEQPGTARKTWHPPGQAKKSVVIYERKGNKAAFQDEANAGISVLVGYEKQRAFYMYWREYGRKGQAAQPIIRPIFDAGIDEAIQAAVDYIAKDHEKRLTA